MSAPTTPSPARCACGASPATRRWEGAAVCVGCHTKRLRESFADAARRLATDRRLNEALREIAADARATKGA